VLFPLQSHLVFRDIISFETAPCFILFSCIKFGFFTGTMSDELISFLNNHVNITQPIREKIQDEEVDLTSFYFLTEVDLQQLGFKMGPRKKLLNLIKCASSVTCTQPVVSCI